MSSPRLKWHDKAIQREILKSKAVRSLGHATGESVAEDAAEHAGNGATFDVETFYGFDRVHTVVRTGNKQASNAETKRGSLTQAGRKRR